MGIAEKIKDIEAEMARTQKNKATEGHLGTLKAKLAKYRSMLLEGDKKSGGPGEGFDVKASGDARVCLFGFPSVGKSTLLNKLTDTKSEVGAYEFTTLTVIPGKIKYKGANIQLLDTPGIIESAAEGRGRGKQVIAVARSADLIVMLLDSAKGDAQKAKLMSELEAVGVRLNQKKPNIYFKRKAGGGIIYNKTCNVSILTEKVVKNILKEYHIHNCEVLLREDANVDEFIDVIEANRRYIPCLFVYNKIDTITLEEVDRVSHLPNSLVISCHWELNLEYLLEKIWEYLALIRVYTKPRGRPPDFEEPVILRTRRDNPTVSTVCRHIHKSLLENFKYGVVWGSSVKFSPQRVGLNQTLEDEDVIQIMKK